MRSPAPAVLAWPADPPPASATPHRGLPQLWLVHPPGCGLANRIQVGQPTDGWVYPPDGGAAGRGGGEGGGDRHAAQAEVLDQALLLEFGEGSERRGDRLLAGAVVGGG